MGGCVWRAQPPSGRAASWPGVRRRRDRLPGRSASRPRRVPNWSWRPCPYGRALRPPHRTYRRSPPHWTPHPPDRHRRRRRSRSRWAPGWGEGSRKRRARWTARGPRTARGPVDGSGSGFGSGSADGSGSGSVDGSGPTDGSGSGSALGSGSRLGSALGSGSGPGASRCTSRDPVQVFFSSTPWPLSTRAQRWNSTNGASAGNFALIRIVVFPGDSTMPSTGTHPFTFPGPRPSRATSVQEPPDSAWTRMCDGRRPGSGETVQPYDEAGDLPMRDVLQHDVELSPVPARFECPGHILEPGPDTPVTPEPVTVRHRPHLTDGEGGRAGEGPCASPGGRRRGRASQEYRGGHRCGGQQRNVSTFHGTTDSFERWRDHQPLDHPAFLIAAFSLSTHKGNFWVQHVTYHRPGAPPPG